MLKVACYVLLLSCQFLLSDGQASIWPDLAGPRAWSVEDHVPSLRSTARRGYRALAAKEHEGVGPICAITASGTKVTCWWTAGLVRDDAERSFTVDLPACLTGATRFLSLRVHLDVWALTDSGHLVVWMGKGAYMSGPGFPTLNTNASTLDVAVSDPSWLGVGVFPGPWQDFWVYSDSAVNPSNDWQPWAVFGAPQDYRRDVCAMGLDGELSCWVLNAGPSVSVNCTRLAGAAQAQPVATCGGWCDLSQHTAPGMSTPICDGEPSSRCTSTGQGPFEHFSWSVSPYDGMFRHPLTANGDGMQAVFGRREHVQNLRNSRESWSGGYLSRLHDGLQFSAGVGTFLAWWCAGNTQMSAGGLWESMDFGGQGWTMPVTAVLHPVGSGNYHTHWFNLQLDFRSGQVTMGTQLWRLSTATCVDRDSFLPPSPTGNFASAPFARLSAPPSLSISSGLHGLLCMLWSNGTGVGDGAVRCNTIRREFGTNSSGNVAFQQGAYNGEGMTYAETGALGPDSFLSAFTPNSLPPWLGPSVSAIDTQSSLVTGGWGTMCVLNGEGRPYCGVLQDGAPTGRSEAFPAPPVHPLSVLSVGHTTALDTFCVHTLSTYGGLTNRSVTTGLSTRTQAALIRCYGAQTAVQASHPFAHPVSSAADAFGNPLAVSDTPLGFGLFTNNAFDLCFLRSRGALVPTAANETTYTTPGACWGSRAGTAAAPYGPYYSAAFSPRGLPWGPPNDLANTTTGVTVTARVHFSALGHTNTFGCAIQNFTYALSSPDCTALDADTELRQTCVSAPRLNYAWCIGRDYPVNVSFVAPCNASLPLNFTGAFGNTSNACNFTRLEDQPAAWYAAVPSNRTQVVALITGPDYACFVTAGAGVLHCLSEDWRRVQALRNAAVSALGGASGVLWVNRSDVSWVNVTGPWSRVVAGATTLCGLHAGQADYVCLPTGAPGPALAYPGRSTFSNTAPLVLSMGWGHGCALEAGTGRVGRVTCFGDDSQGQVSGPNSVTTTFSHIMAMRQSTCGVTTAGLVRCWGSLARLHTERFVITPMPALSAAVTHPTLAREFTVGLGGASDATCAVTGTCATLQAAVDAASRLPVYARPVNITVSARITLTAPVLVTAQAAGVRIQGAPGGAGVLAFSGTAATASLLTIDAVNAAVADLTFTTNGAAASCGEAVLWRGNRALLQRVHFQSITCARALVRFLGSSGSNVAANLPGLYQWSTNGHTSDARLESLSFAQATATTFVRFDRGFPRVSVWNVTAVAADPVSSPFQARFLGLHHSPSTHASLWLSDITVSGFQWDSNSTAARAARDVPDVTPFQCWDACGGGGLGGAFLYSAGTYRILMQRITASYLSAPAGPFLYTDYGTHTLHMVNITVSHTRTFVPSGFSISPLRRTRAGFYAGLGDQIGRGGAILHQGINWPELAVFYMERATFFNTTAVSDGGALWFGPWGYGWRVSLLHASFTRCTSTQGAGGAILVDIEQDHFMDWTIANTVFSDTSAALDGGAIAAVNFAHGQLTLTDVSFSRSQAGRNGGALFLRRLARVFATRVTSSQTSAAAGGGSLWVAFGLEGCGGGSACDPTDPSSANVLSIRDSSFAACSCTGPADAFLGGMGRGCAGGCIWSDTPRLLYLNTTMRDAWSTGEGGCLRSLAVYSQIQGSAFTNCTAASSPLSDWGGGGALALVQSFFIEVTNVSVSQCSAPTGGCISVQTARNGFGPALGLDFASGTRTVIGTAATASECAAICLRTGWCRLYQFLWPGCQSGGGGNCFAVNEGGGTTLVTGNNVGTDCSSVGSNRVQHAHVQPFVQRYTSFGTGDPMSAAFTSVFIQDGTSTRGSGGCFAYSATAPMISPNLLRVVASNFSQCRSASDGGAAFLDLTSARGIQLEAVSLSSSTAEGDGGCMSVEHAYLALQSQPPVANFWMRRNSSLLSCLSGRRGGAVFFDLNALLSVDIASTRSVDSTAMGEGGAFALVGDQSSNTGQRFFTMSDSTVSNGMSGRVGGAVALSLQSQSDCSAVVSVTRSTLQGCFANEGGALFLRGSPVSERSSRCTLSTSIIRGNMVRTDGAGVSVRAVTTFLQAVTLRGNTAGQSGGGLVIRGSALDFNQVLIADNRAVQGVGAGIAALACSGTGVTASYTPTAVSLRGSAWQQWISQPGEEHRLLGLVLVNNSAYSDGGGVYIQGCATDLPYVVAVDNRAGLAGVSSASVLAGSSAAGGGGALTAASASGEFYVGLRHAVFVGNRALSADLGSGGGALLLRSASGYQPLCQPLALDGVVPANGYMQETPQNNVWRAQALAYALNTSRLAPSAVTQSLLGWMPLQQVRPEPSTPTAVPSLFQWTEEHNIPLYSCACNATIPLGGANNSWTVRSAPGFFLRTSPARFRPTVLSCSTPRTCCVISLSVALLPLTSQNPDPPLQLNGVTVTHDQGIQVPRVCDCQLLTGARGFTSVPTATAADLASYYPYPRLRLLAGQTTCPAHWEDVDARSSLSTTYARSFDVNYTVPALPQALAVGICLGTLSPGHGLTTGCDCLAAVCPLLASIAAWTDTWGYAAPIASAWSESTPGAFPPVVPPPVSPRANSSLVFPMAAGAPGPWQVEQQYSCFFVGNSADRSIGGDLAVTPFDGFSARVSLSAVYSHGAFSGARGGSMAFERINQVELQAVAINASAAAGVRSTGGSVLTVPGRGGGLAVTSALRLTLANVSVQSSTAHEGGALFMQRVVEGPEGDRNALTFATADVVALSNVSLVGNSARFAGGAVYTDLGSPPACSNCHIVNNTALLGGAVTATSARRVVLVSTPYQRITNASDGSRVLASAVIGGIAVEQPLATLRVVDLLNATLEADNETYCDITAVRTGAQASVLPLSFESRYRAVSGLVRLFPFAVSVGPGVSGRVTVACTTSTGRALPALSILLVTDLVRTQWLTPSGQAISSTQSVPIQYVVPSTIASPRFVSTPLAVGMVDASGLPISSVSVSCGITVESSFKWEAATATWTRTSASIMGQTSSTTVVGSGIAYFTPAIQSDSNTTVYLAASCTWITGDLVSADVTMPLRTYPLLIALGRLPVSNITEALLTPALSLFPAAPLPAPTSTIPMALPSSTDINTMQLLYLSPAPWVVVMVSDPVGGVLPIADPPVACTMATMPEHGRTAWAAILAAANPTGSLPSDWSVVNDTSSAVQAQGVLSLSTQGAVAVFPQVAIRSATFRAFIPLQVSCSWTTGELLRSPPFVAATSSLAAQFSVAPPTWVLPSSQGIASLIALSPAPVVRLMKRNMRGLGLVPGPGNTTVDSDPPEHLLGFTLQCTMRLHVVSLPPVDQGLRPSLVGTPDAVMDASTGEAVWSRIGITGPFGSVVQLLGVCTWVSGIEVAVTSAPITLATLRLRVMAEPPAMFLPTNPSSISPMTPAPQLRVETDDPSKVGAAGSTQDGWSALVGYSLTVSLSLSLPVQDAGVSPSSIILQGDTVAATSTSSAEALFNRVAVSGAFGGRFLLGFTASFVNGQALFASTLEKRLPYVWVSWGTTGVEESLGMVPPGVLTGTRPPAYVLYNTPLQDVGVTVSFDASAPRGGYDPTGGNLLGRQGWESLGTTAGDLRCNFDAVAGSTAVVVTGSASVVASPNGTSVFKGLALLPAAGSEGQPLTIRMSCTLRGLALAPISATGILQRLTVAWDVPPPLQTLPSSQTENQPFPSTVRIRVTNHTGGMLREETGTTCTLSVLDTLFAPSTPDEQKRALLLGNTRAVIIEGSTTFPGLAISAPFGARVNITAACTRPQGGVIISAQALIIIAMIDVTWVALPPQYVLYNTPEPMSVRVQRYVADPNRGWQPVAGTRTVEAGIRCSISAVPGPEYGGNVSVTISGSSTDSNTVTAAGTGIAAFRLSLLTATRTRTIVTVQCTRADQIVAAPSRDVYVEEVSLEFVQAPPPVWMPSSDLAKTSLTPEPSLLLRRPARAGWGITGHVDARGVTCRADVSPRALDSVRGPVVADAPLDGYRLSLVIVDAEGNAKDLAADPLLASNLTSFASTIPIRFGGVFLRAPFGSSFNLSFVCTRSQGDSTAVLMWPMRITDHGIRYSTTPPASTESQKLFRFAVEIFDRQLEWLEGEYKASLEAVAGNRSLIPYTPPGYWTAPPSGTTSFANVTSAVTPWPDQWTDHATVVTLDAVTACRLTISTQDPGIVLQNPTAEARAGIAVFAGVALQARVGTIVQGSVACTLGSMEYPDRLPFALRMEPCSVGKAPTGLQGYECVECATGTYSDGGLDARCITCPRGGGVQCTGGRLRLLPGYFRADKQDIINERSEFHNCWNKEACVVDVETTNRSWTRTHSCARGYEGPLCGVCDADMDYASLGDTCKPCLPRGFSLAVVSLMPIAIFGVVFYIAAVRRQTKGSQSQAIFRIFLTWVSTLGTLGSLYIARGTALFREVFGFSDVVGSSPLQVLPVQCTLRLGFFTRYAVTAALPLIMAFLSILVAVCVVLHLETTRCSGKSRALWRRTMPLWLGGRVPQQAGKGRSFAPSQTKANDSELSYNFKQGAVKSVEGSAEASSGGGADRSIIRVAAPTSSYARAAARLGERGDSSTLEVAVNPLARATSPDKPSLLSSTQVRWSLSGRDLRATQKQLTRRGSADEPRSVKTFAQQFSYILRSCARRIDLRVLAYFNTQAYLAPVIFILNISYASITTSSFSVFNCLPYSIGSGPRGTDPTFFLTTDVSVECNTLEHTIWRAVAGVVIASAVAGLPLYFFLMLRRARRRDMLDDPMFFSRYGFLYDGYALDRGMEGWESLIMFRKAAVVVIGSLIKDSVYQIAASIILLVICLFLHASYQPFESALLNRLESASFITIILTQLTSLFYLRYDLIIAPCNSQDGSFPLDTSGITCAEMLGRRMLNDGVTTGILLVLNIGFGAATLRLLFLSIFRKVKDSEPVIRVRNAVRRMRGKQRVDEVTVRDRRLLAHAAELHERSKFAGVDALAPDGIGSSSEDEDGGTAGGSGGRSSSGAGAAGGGVSTGADHKAKVKAEKDREHRTAAMAAALPVPSISTLRAPRSKVQAFYGQALLHGGSSSRHLILGRGSSSSSAAFTQADSAVVSNPMHALTGARPQHHPHASADPHVSALLAGRRTFDPLGLDLSAVSHALDSARKEAEAQLEYKAKRDKAMQELIKNSGRAKLYGLEEGSEGKRSRGSSREREQSDKEAADVQSLGLTWGKKPAARAPLSSSSPGPAGAEGKAHGSTGSFLLSSLSLSLPASFSSFLGGTRSGTGSGGGESAAAAEASSAPTSAGPAAGSMATTAPARIVLRAASFRSDGWGSDEEEEGDEDEEGGAEGGAKGKGDSRASAGLRAGEGQGSSSWSVASGAGIRAFPSAVAAKAGAGAGVGAGKVGRGGVVTGSVTGKLALARAAGPGSSKRLVAPTASSGGAGTRFTAPPAAASVVVREGTSSTLASSAPAPTPQGHSGEGLGDRGWSSSEEEEEGDEGGGEQQQQARAVANPYAWQEEDAPGLLLDPFAAEGGGEDEDGDWEEDSFPDRASDLMAEGEAAAGHGQGGDKEDREEEADDWAD